MKAFLLLGLILAHTATLQARNLTYGLFDGDKRVGEVNIRRVEDGKVIKLESEGIVTVRFILSFRIYSYYRVWTDDHGMLSSHVKGMRDDTVTGESTGYRYGGEYITIVDDEIVKTSMPVTTSLLQLYYEEPEGLTEIFSEKEGLYLPIENLGDHRYKLTTFSGRPTLYTYENGIPVEVTFNTFLGTVIFRLEQTGMP